MNINTPSQEGNLSKADGLKARDTYLPFEKNMGLEVLSLVELIRVQNLNYIH